MIYFETNNVKLAFSYLNDLIPFGLLFAPIQKHINYSKTQSLKSLKSLKIA